MPAKTSQRETRSEPDIRFSAASARLNREVRHFVERCCLSGRIDGDVPADNINALGGWGASEDLWSELSIYDADVLELPVAHTS